MTMMHFTAGPLERPGSGRQRFRAWIATGRGRLLAEVLRTGSTDMMRRAVRDQILDLPVRLFHFVPDRLSSVVRAWFDVERVERPRAHRRPRPSSGGPRHAVPYDITRRGELLSEHVLPLIGNVAPGWEFTLVAKRGT